MRGMRFSDLRRFVKDTDALVTVQVVIFSVMLFSAIGMVIDFGRAYSAHSRMQAYIDQVALAAAAELDGLNATTGNNPQADAIARATAAANSVSKKSIFTSQGGEFQIQQLRFLSSSPTDVNGNFDPAMIADAPDPSRATHVLAIAQEASVRASLLDLNIGSGGTVGDINLGTYAVATARQVTCQDMSTLVMCNPFETSATSTNFKDVMKNGEGFRMRLTADLNQGLNSTATSIGLGLIKNPSGQLGTASGACENPVDMPGYSSGLTAAELEKLRDACLLAVVDTGLSCVNDQVLVKAAAPGVVTTGVDVRFDMYDGPMAEVLDPAYPYYDLFYPDKASVHGRITRAEFVVQLQERHELIYELTTDLVFFDQVANEMCLISCSPRGYSFTDAQTDLSASLAAMISEMSSRVPNYDATVQNFDVSANVYPVTPSLQGSRQDHIRNGTEFHMIRFTCLDEGQSCNFGIHGAITNQSPSPEEYALDYYTPLGSNLTQGTTTNYKFYSTIERNNTQFSPVVASSGVDAFDKADGPAWALNEQFPQDTSLTQTEPVNYLTAHGMAVNALGPVERRRMRVGVVDCAAKQTYASVTGDNNTAYADSYYVNVVDVVDVFLTEAPVIHECATPYTPSTDPNDINPCSNDDITSMSLIAEYIEPVTEDRVSSKTRRYAVLVH